MIYDYGVFHIKNSRITYLFYLFSSIPYPNYCVLVVTIRI